MLVSFHRASAMLWSVWQINAGYCMRFLSPQAFFCFLKCCYSSGAECPQDQLCIGTPYVETNENFHRTYVVLIYRASTFCKLNVCSALETPKLKNANASRKVPKASISYEFTVQNHGIQAKCRCCNVWPFLQEFQLVTNWGWVIYSKRSVKLVTKDQISDQDWSLNAFVNYLHQFV